MDLAALLLPTGTVLLGIAALTGFAQARTTRGTEAESKWRVVHSGGTAGGVQLLALSAVWSTLTGPSLVASVTAASIVVATWLFFLGPLLKALAWPRTGNWALWAGAALAIPGYVGLIGLGFRMG